MGNKYVSMQEELAARKAAAGIETPRAQYHKEPEKEALSSKFKGVLDKGVRKTSGRVKTRKVKGFDLKKAFEISEEAADGWRTGRRRQEAAEAADTEPVDAVVISESISEAKADRNGKIIMAAVCAAFALVFALTMFSDDPADYYDDDETDIVDMTDYYEIPDGASDETIMAVVDDELGFYDPVDQQELSRWIQDTDTIGLVGDDLRFVHVSQGDKYITATIHFEDENEYDFEERCQEASSNLQEALSEEEFDNLPRVVIIARKQEGNDLLYVMLDNEICYSGEYYPGEDGEDL